MPRCMLCNRKLKYIAPKHLEVVHGISTEEYRSQFPDASLTSRKVIRKRNAAIADSWKRLITSLIDNGLKSITRSWKEGKRQFVKGDFRYET